MYHETVSSSVFPGQKKIFRRVFSECVHGKLQTLTQVANREVHGSNLVARRLPASPGSGTHVNNFGV